MNSCTYTYKFEILSNVIYYNTCMIYSVHWYILYISMVYSIHVSKFYLEKNFKLRYYLRFYFLNRYYIYKIKI